MTISRPNTNVSRLPKTLNPDRGLSFHKSRAYQLLSILCFINVNQLNIKCCLTLGCLKICSSKKLYANSKLFTSSSIKNSIITYNP